MGELKVQAGEADVPKLNEREVVAYLKAHPVFLSRHLDLLEAIELKHKAGSAVSLIEKQVKTSSNACWRRPTRTKSAPRTCSAWRAR